MSNRSKINDPRFWRKWESSGAVETLADAEARSFEEEMIAGIVRVAVANDYSNWKPVPRPPLGELVLLHQIYEGETACLYCGKPVSEWGSLQKCPARYDKKIA